MRVLWQYSSWTKKGSQLIIVFQNRHMTTGNHNLILRLFSFMLVVLKIVWKQVWKIETDKFISKLSPESKELIKSIHTLIHRPHLLLPYIEGQEADWVNTLKSKDNFPNLTKWLSQNLIFPHLNTTNLQHHIYHNTGKLLHRSLISEVHIAKYENKNWHRWRGTRLFVQLIHK